MRDEYDSANGRKNPYAKQQKKQITINISEEAISYFKEMAETSGIPYQMLVNLYLTDCAKNKRRLSISWKEGDDMENVSMSSERSLCADLLRAKVDRAHGVEYVPADEVMASMERAIKEAASVHRSGCGLPEPGPSGLTDHK